MTKNETRSILPIHPPRGPMIAVFLLLGLAAVALVGPWRVDDTSRLAVGVATVCVLAAFGTATCIVGSAARPGAEPRGQSPSDWGPLLERLDRIAAALESRPMSAAVEGTETSRLGHRAIAEAIAEGRWTDAESLLGELPDDPDTARLADGLASARRATEERLSGELKAAQEVGDPGRVLEIHAGLGALLPAEEGKTLDTALAKWFLALIMKRLRTGTVRPDVAELAGAVAGRFSRTVEGASLRASLPTLRRSAGLCPRCARPYRGVADACPICLASPPVVPSGPPEIPGPGGSTGEA